MAIDTTLLEALIAATPTPGGYWTKEILEELLDNLDDLETQIGSASATVVTDGVTITGDGTATAALTVANPLPVVSASDNAKVLTVVSGTWTAEAAASGLPAITSSSDTVVLTVVSGTTSAVWTTGVAGPKGDTGDTGAAGGFSSVQTISAITGNYTLQLTDAGKLLKVTASAVLTVPLNSSVAFSTGQHIDVAAWTSASVTFTAASASVTIREPFGDKIKTQYGAATLVKMDTNEWLLIGDLESSV